MHIKNQTSKSQKNKSYIIAIVCIVILAVILGVSLYAKYSNNTTESVNHSDSSTGSADSLTTKPDTSEQTDAANAIKENSVNNQSTNTSPDANNTLQLTVVSSPSQTGPTIQIRVSIDNAILSEGTCSLSLTKNNIVKSYISDIQALASSSACKNFNIPASDLGGVTGEWTITVTADSGIKSGTASSKVTVS